jgi:hypothetical protein
MSDLKKLKKEVKFWFFLAMYMTIILACAIYVEFKELQNKEVIDEA